MTIEYQNTLGPLGPSVEEIPRRERSECTARLPRRSRLAVTRLLVSRAVAHFIYRSLCVLCKAFLIERWQQLVQS